jgi:hypothetical protein
LNWHDRLDHLGVRIMRKIIGNCTCHDLKGAKFSKSDDFVCTSCVT